VNRNLAGWIGLAGVYLVLFGVGSTIWWVTAAGAGLLATAALLVVLATVRARGYTTVLGFANVLTVSDPPQNQAFGRCEMTVLVQATGLRSTEVLVRDPRVPVAKWPAPGDLLPVRVVPSNPRRLRVLWEKATVYIPS
jgi:resuscitation-promoting factor RpfA